MDAVVSQGARGPWTVSGLLVATADALAARFGAVAVRGELSGFSRAASGHCYFSLKDADGAPALLRCAMFRRAASLVDFAPGDGQQVELRGRLGVYDARGELQMVVESMQRVGAGALYEEFLRRRAKLAAEGLFDPSRKRALPVFPQGLAVVTSTGAAALRDVLTTLQRRAPQVHVVVVPTPVQGADAPVAIAEAIARANALAPSARLQTLLLVRGGGALEDLWAFNDERVVRAIAASVLPVVCGVGHETDVTLADLVADVRAPTPTAAAELAAPAQDEALRGLDQAAARLQNAAQRQLQGLAQRLDHLSLRMGQPARGLAGAAQHLDALSHRLLQGLRQAHGRQTERLARAALRLRQSAHAPLQQAPLRLQAMAERLAAQDPARVLSRGYAWVESLDGRPVLGVTGLRQGQAVRAVWADGRAEAEVLRVEPLPPKV
jgi:exodeoxyribonuclease VII large subunit